jgi:hypothetical protein
MIFSPRFDVFDYSTFQKITEVKTEITVYWAVTNLTLSFSLGKTVAFLFLNEEN